MEGEGNVAEQEKKVQEPDLNQLRKVRREKLADLQANGKDPFLITKYDVTAHAAEIKDNYETMEERKYPVLCCKRQRWGGFI